MGIVKATFAAYRRHRFAILFFTLLATLAARGVFEVLAFHWNPLELLLAVNFVAAASAARESRGPLAFAAVFLVARAAAEVLGIHAVLSLSEAAWVAGCLTATAVTVRHVMRPGVVDRERIFAALDAYILTGIVFGVCYFILDRAWPGSLRTPSASSLTVAEAIYFSFVTIATLGYGDIVPVSGPARGLAIVEAVGGQMYLAVLVARLVSLYVKEGSA